MRNQTNQSLRRGLALVWVALVLPVLIGFAAFAIDVGMMQFWRTRCQNTADISARTAAWGMIESGGDLVYCAGLAIAYAEMNMPDEGTVLAAGDVTFGTWDRDARTFTPTEQNPNAVQVVVRRAQANDNPLPLIFAQIWGRDQADVSAIAIATIPRQGGPEFRFLIDDEMIDTDEPAIQQLAQQLGKTPDDLVADRDGDGFIDFPPGRQLWLPTGQVGDEALFDRSQWPDIFPFKPTSQYTTLDFMLFGTNLQHVYRTLDLKDITWRSSNAPHRDFIGKKVLDPVPGITMMSSHQQIMDLPDPDQVWVSPVYKSDIGMIERTTQKYGWPLANLLGERRAGLFAFTILDARPSTRGGSYLPDILIEVVDPVTIDVIAVANGTAQSEGDEDAAPEMVR